MNKDQLLKLIAGELVGVVKVHMRQRDSETKQVIIDELVGLEFDRTHVTMVSSDNPHSRFVGARLQLSDLRSDIVLHLGLTRQQEWFRRVLQRHFRPQLERYREMLWRLKAVNLSPVLPRHFQAGCTEGDLLRRMTAQGCLVVKRRVEPGKLAVSFELVHAPTTHPLNEHSKRASIIVDFIDGWPARYDGRSPQALFLAELLSFGKVTVTAW